MSQRKALIASLVITLVLGLSAIGIRAAMVDSPMSAADSTAALTLVQPGGEFDDDDQFETSDDDAFEGSNDAFQDSEDDDNDGDSGEDHEDEDVEDDEE